MKFLAELVAEVFAHHTEHKGDVSDSVAAVIAANEGLSQNTMRLLRQFFQVTPK